MQSSVTFSNKSGFTNAKDASLKTSNPTIFPSLHPFSSFYSQKRPATPSFAGHSEVKEPVKKVKLENKSQELVIKRSNSVKEEKQKADDYVFRVPQLPKRLRNKNQVNQKKAQVQPKVESVVIPEIVAENLRDACNYSENQFAFGFNPMALNNLYERLQYAYMSLQMNQNFINEYQNNQYRFRNIKLSC